MSLLRRNIPLWVHEGGAEYERGIWDPLDLMTVRDAAVADIIPRMSQMEGYGDFGSVRLVYNLGHALYEFIEARWGKDGVRQFLFALRKTAIGGGSSPYEEAFQMPAREFDQQFEKYLKDRFKPFRDKERPADYGQDLSPDPQRTDYTGAISIEPSPSGDLIAVMTGNRRDQELDIILISSKDGSVVRNLTSGFDMDRGFEYIAFPSLNNMVAWMSWSPVGDRLAYFVRNEKYKTLILQNVLTGNIEQRFNIATVDNPESPNISPDGRSVHLRRPPQRDGRHLQARCGHRRNHQPHQRRVRATTRPSTLPTAASWCIWPASADRRSCSASTWPPTRRPSSPSARRTRPPSSSSTSTRSSSRRPRQTRRRRSRPKSPATATSSICGRSA